MQKKIRIINDELRMRILKNGFGRLSVVQRSLLAGAFCACVLGSMAQDAQIDTPTRVLLKSVYRLGVQGQITAQAKRLAEPLDAQTTVEVESAVDVFRAEIGESIRTELEGVFGTTARDEFGGFVEAFTQAEVANDLDFLARIVSSAGDWGQVPTTYEALRGAMVQDVLKADIETAGKFLADIQTWLDLRKKSDEVPLLRVWLDRDKPMQPVVQESAKPKRKRNPLRDAEASAETFDGSGGDEGSALESFGLARTERRQKALEDARAGMQQVAEERRVAEDEMASKKIAAAQAEGEAVRKQAEKLAASESEAIEQRRNSWSGRLKSILSTTIGATSGAFLGQVGSRAGEAAADAVFKTEK